jgi:MFS family permease
VSHEPAGLAHSGGSGAAVPRAPTMFQAFQSRNFVRYWSGALLSNIGSWMQTVALGWLVLQLTDSPFWVGFVSFAALSPSLFLSLFGGVLADRSDRRQVMMIAQVVMLLSTAVLATLTACGVITVPEIVLLSFLTGLGGALSMPAQQAIISDLVPPEVLLNANSLNSVQFNLARVLGPAVAGTVIAWLGMAACFYINSISFLALILALRAIHIAPRRPLGAVSFWRHLGEGVRYVRHHRLVLLNLVTAGVLSVFCLPYIVLMPVFARDVLHGGPNLLGYLLSAAGVGAVVGGLCLAAFGDVRDKPRLVLRAGAMLSLAVVGFALSRYVYLSLAILLIAGASMITCMATLNTQLQLAVEPQVRGRVLSMYSMTLFGLAPLGSLQAGTLAHFIGTPAAVALGGSLCFVFLLCALQRVDRVAAESAVPVS